MYTFEQLNKGDIISIKESKESRSFYYQEQLIMTCEKPTRPVAAEVRQVKAEGKVKFQNQYYQLQGVSKGTVVLIARVEEKLHFSVNGELLLVTEGQISVQQPI